MLRSAPLSRPPARWGVPMNRRRSDGDRHRVAVPCRQRRNEWQPCCDRSERCARGRPQPRL